MSKYKIFVNLKKGEKYNTSMHFRNALNAAIYAVSRAFFTQSLAKFRRLLSVRKWGIRILRLPRIITTMRHRIRSIKKARFPGLYLYD